MPSQAPSAFPLQSAERESEQPPGYEGRPCKTFTDSMQLQLPATEMSEILRRIAPGSGQAYRIENAWVYAILQGVGALMEPHGQLLDLKATRELGKR